VAGNLSASTVPRAGASPRWRVAAPLALMAAIAIASHGPLPVGLPGPSDKLVHAAVFGLLAVLWYWARRGTDGAGRAALTAVALAALWGALDEVHQSFVPGRTADGLDLLADAAGAALAALACFAATRARRG
jgi:VanZ family protein